MNQLAQMIWIVKAHQQRYAALQHFAEQGARLKQDGEDDFIMENDDAVETLNRLIYEARAITTPKTPTVRQPSL